MALITKYYEKKNQLEQLKEELKTLEQSDALKDDLAFEKKIKDLMDKHDKTPFDVLGILSAMEPAIGAGSTRTAESTQPKRPMQTYKNPHTGEVVKTRGANHKTLKQWRDEHGRDTVASWKVD